MPSDDTLSHDQRRSRRPPTDRKLRRSHNRVIAGVAAGFAEYIDAKPNLMRWIFGVVTVVTSGFFVLVYLLLWLILPKPPDEPAS
jgi:phage shock protein C